MRAVSAKMTAQKRKENLLSIKMLTKCGGLCMICGRWPDGYGLSKHEITFRSHGGDPLDEANCLLLCRECHAKQLTNGVITR